MLNENNLKEEENVDATNKTSNLGKNIVFKSSIAKTINKLNDGIACAVIILCVIAFCAGIITLGDEGGLPVIISIIIGVNTLLIHAVIQGFANIVENVQEIKDNLKDK